MTPFALFRKHFRPWHLLPYALILLVSSAGVLAAVQHITQTTQVATTHHGLGKPDSAKGVDPCATITTDQVHAATGWTNVRVMYNTDSTQTRYTDFAQRTCDIQGEGGLHMFVITWVDSSIGDTGPKYASLAGRIRAVAFTEETGFKGAQGAIFFGTTNDPTAYNGVLLTANGVVVQVAQYFPYNVPSPRIGRQALSFLAGDAVRYIDD